MDVKKIFAERVKEELKGESITQKELAKRTGLSEAYISQIIKGKKTPTITVANRIAEALGKPLSYFLDSSLDISVFLRRNSTLSEDDIRAIEAFIQYIIDKKNHNHSSHV